MNITRRLFKGIVNTFKEFAGFSVITLGGILSFVLVAIFFVIGPIFLIYVVLSGAIAGVDVINSIGDKSRSFFGFSSAFLLFLGIPLIWLIYRSKSLKRREYYRRRREGRLSNSEQDIDTMWFWSETGTNQIIGFGSIFIVFIFVTIRLSVDFMPIFFVINIASWLISSAIYRLKYCPIKLANPSLGTFEEPSSEFRKLQEIQIAIWGIPLLAALVSGFIQYTATNQ